MAWWSEVIWYWVFVVALLVGMSKMHRVTILTLMIFICILGIVVVLSIFAGVQPRIVG